MSDILLYIGSAVIFLWGVSHVAALKPVVDAYGAISQDNRRIITMEWIFEGLAMCFIGVLVAVVTLRAEGPVAVSVLVIRFSAVMLLVMAGVSVFTGAKTSILPMKLCPVVKTVVATLMFVGSTV